MRRILLGLAFTALFIFMAIYNNAHSMQNGITKIIAPRHDVRQYELYEIGVHISAPYKNPHDADEVDVSASITAPDGETFDAPGFYSGSASLWKVRYTPTKTGKFGYKLTLKTPQKKYTSGLRYFKVLPSDKDGFVRRSANNPYYPVFDSGKSFIGLGYNIAWSNIPVYERYFASFPENGLNLTRVWLNSPWTFDIEREELGNYNASESEKVDALLNLAEKYGIYIILTLDSYSSLMDEKGFWGEDRWKINPYNKANMGPCEKPGEFFTDEEAKRYYRNRLRYIIARWGYSPNIVAFELWNEMDAPAGWTEDASSYIKSINPHGQFITTSLDYPYSNNFDESSIWSLNGIDIIDRHIYGNKVGDLIGNLVSVNTALSEKYKKYIITGEFGLDGIKNDVELDRVGNGTALRASLWASVLTRSFAGALNWWWAEYINAKNLYPHYKGLRNFVRDVNWDSKNVAPLKTTPVIYPDGGKDAAQYSDVDIATQDVWGDIKYTEFTIGNSGDVSGGVLNMYLHGASKKDLKVEPVLHVNYPADGKFALHVDTVSQGAELVICIDGGKALNKELAAGAGEGPWKKSLYRKEYNIYQCVYDERFEIDVPKGAHTIKLSNTGKDWISIKKITLVNYKDKSFVNARVVGLGLDDEMLAWIQNKDWDWRNDILRKYPAYIKGASFRIRDADSGSYKIEWWDTFSGTIISVQNAEAKGGELEVAIPDFDKDIACKIRRASK